MFSPANLFRMMVELIFVLLGGFLVWLGLTTSFIFDPRSPSWLGLGAVLVYWGVRTWMKTMRAARTADRTITRIGGASLAAIGCVMLGLVFVEFRWVGPILAITGVILVVRGLAGAVLSFRAD
jgi:hypothetical protein